MTLNQFRQLSRLTHKHIYRHHKRHVVRRHHVKKHESVGEWYLHHAKRIWNTNDQNGDDNNFGTMYDKACEDVDGGAAGEAGYGSGNLINPRYITNRFYHDGWVIDEANNGQSLDAPSLSYGGTVNAYSHLNRIYNKGVQYIKAHHYRKDIKYSFTKGTWHLTNETSDMY